MKKNKEIGYVVGCPNCNCGGIAYSAEEDEKYAHYTVWRERKYAIEEALHLKEITGEMPVIYEVKLTW